MASKRPFTTYDEYIKTVCASCPEPFPDSFARYMAGVWLRKGSFKLAKDAVLPTKKEDPAFWQGYDSEPEKR